MGPPRGCSGQDSTLPVQGERVQSLVQELRSHMLGSHIPHAWPKNLTNKKRDDSYQPGHKQSFSSVLANVREEIPLSHPCGEMYLPVSFE